MKVKELLKELSECPERREELLGSVVETVIVYHTYGYEKAGRGFDDLLRVSFELYGERVTKERWLELIEHDLRQMDEDYEVGFRAVLADTRCVEPIEPVELDINSLKLPEIREVVDVDEWKTPPPPYRPKLKQYDKRRNFKPKNIWNRIRSRCF